MNREETAFLNLESAVTAVLALRGVVAHLNTDEGTLADDLAIAFGIAARQLREGWETFVEERHAAKSTG